MRLDLPHDELPGRRQPEPSPPRSISCAISTGASPPQGRRLNRTRLVSLDYILENNDDQYLETPSGKLHFFTKVRNIPAAFLDGTSGQASESIETFPAALEDREHPSSSLVRFAFLDEGMLSTVNCPLPRRAYTAASRRAGLRGGIRRDLETQLPRG